MLEVLDPEQNYSFVDHYLDVAFDLSHVMFITTANILETIPPALRDRLEVIELIGYTIDEKLKIAERYLIPRQIEANGLTSKQINFTVAAKKQIITGYTREAGVRNLEREIANICRGVASEIAQEEIKSASIKIKDLHKYIGPVKITSEGKTRISKPGVAVGLAWTPVGGEILYIEATAMKGNKGLMLTGQLGEIMKESASAALSFHTIECGQIWDSERLLRQQGHSYPYSCGRYPKRRPLGRCDYTHSTCIASYEPEHQTRPGHDRVKITLRGAVLPVGGIKEKILAAHRAGY